MSPQLNGATGVRLPLTLGAAFNVRVVEWQTRNLEVVVLTGVKVQVLSRTPYWVGEIGKHGGFKLHCFGLWVQVLHPVPFFCIIEDMADNVIDFIHRRFPDDCSWLDGN